MSTSTSGGELLTMYSRISGGASADKNAVRSVVSCTTCGGKGHILKYASRSLDTHVGIQYLQLPKIPLKGGGACKSFVPNMSKW